MRRSIGLLLALVLTSSAVVSWGSAGAVEILASGRINVDSDFGSCASVSFPTSQAVIIGEFSAVGYSATPAQTQNGATSGIVADAVPIIRTSATTWSGCLSGAGSPVVSGTATFTLETSGPGGDVLIVKKCVVASGNMTCAGI